MDETLVYLLAAVGTYICAECIHEFGHYTTGYIIGFKPKMHFDNMNVPHMVTQHYNTYNKKYLKLTGISGILVGFIPFYWYYTIINNPIAFLFLLVMIVVYIGACSYDIERLLKYEPIQVKLTDFSE